MALGRRPGRRGRSPRRSRSSQPPAPSRGSARASCSPTSTTTRYCSTRDAAASACTRAHTRDRPGQPVRRARRRCPTCRARSSRTRRTASAPARCAGSPLRCRSFRRRTSARSAMPARCSRTTLSSRTRSHCSARKARGRSTTMSRSAEISGSMRCRPRSCAPSSRTSPLHGRATRARRALPRAIRRGATCQPSCACRRRSDVARRIHQFVIRAPRRDALRAHLADAGSRRPRSTTPSHSTCSRASPSSAIARVHSRVAERACRRCARASHPSGACAKTRRAYVVDRIAAFYRG